MKLLFVIDSLGSGGAQRQMVTLAMGLSQRGHDVEFFIHHPLDHFRSLLDAAGIKIHMRKKFHKYDPTIPFSLRKIMRNGEFDLALAFLETPAVYLELASFGLRCKVVASERFTYPPGHLTLKRRMIQNLHRLADHITVNSNHQREKMERTFPWMNGRLTTILNGVDFTRFSPSADQDALPRKPVRLLSVGRVLSVKNAHNLVTALKLVKDRGHDVVVDWAGTRNLIPDYVARIDRQIDELGVADCFNWLGERKDIPDLMRKTDGIIHPSFFEGLPNAICEGLASGVPILAGDVCDHAMLLDNGKNGILFEPSAPESIADAICKFCELSANQRTTMGGNARSFAEAKLTPERLINEYERLFHSLICEKASQ